MKYFILCFLLSLNLCIAAQDTVRVGSANNDLTAEDEYNKGLEALQKKDYEQAAAFFSRSIELKPGFGKALSNRAVAFSNLQKYNEALTDIRLAIQINPENPDNYFNKSIIFFQENKKDSQDLALDECLKLKANHSEALYFKGLLALDKGETEAAIVYYTKAIENNPKYVYAYNDRASAKRKKGDYAGAIADYGKALEIDSSLVFIYNNLGSAYRGSRNYQKAVQCYNKALQLDPKYFTALINRGATYIENNNFKAGEADFEAALNVDPKSSFAYNNLASVSIKTKDYKKAKEHASRAIVLDPLNGPAYYNRGIANQMLRDEEASCADWKKAFELGVSGAKNFMNANCPN